MVLGARELGCDAIEATEGGPRAQLEAPCLARYSAIRQAVDTVDAVVDWAPLLVPEPELAEEIIETLSLGAMHLTAFLLDDDVGTDDVSLLLAETHAGDPTGGCGGDFGVGK